ncbi:MAG: phosphate ABC transporter ATP-binding protein [Planctomycetota bacterium]
MTQTNPAPLKLVQATPEPAAPETLIRSCCLSVHYDGRPAVRDVDLEIARGRVTAIIGPSGCGKSSFLASLNRMTDLVPGCSVTGAVRIGDTDIFEKPCDPVTLRRQVGMIFQKPNPFAMSIKKNLTMPLKEHGVRKRADRDAAAEAVLRDVGLWEEVKDRLNASALSLSGGQQQRLCIARALILKPKVLLMDEPCSALDPIASGVIEDLILKLRGGCCATEKSGSVDEAPLTLVVVTHNLAQARRIADDTAVFWVRDGVGAMIEAGPTEQIFGSPREEESRQYIRGMRG